MKKLLLNFLFLLLIGCSSTQYQSKEISIIDCPRVFFSSENNVYVDSQEKDTDLENTNYKASLNNYGFVKGCFFNSISNNYNLDLLILVEPFNPINADISFPIFLLLYDFEDRLIEKQYFRVESSFSSNIETSEYEKTDIIENLNIITDKNVNSITIGFVKLN